MNRTSFKTGKNRKATDIERKGKIQGLNERKRMAQWKNQLNRKERKLASI
jgi:hypothetical protein